MSMSSFLSESCLTCGHVPALLLPSDGPLAGGWLVIFTLLNKNFRDLKLWVLMWCLEEEAEQTTLEAIAIQVANEHFIRNILCCEKDGAWSQS